MTKAQVLLGTHIVMLVGIALWVVWDVYAATRGQSGVTISAATWAAIKNNPWIPFLTGFVCGHLFWQSSSGN